MEKRKFCLITDDPQQSSSEKDFKTPYGRKKKINCQVSHCNGCEDNSSISFHSNNYKIENGLFQTIIDDMMNQRQKIDNLFDSLVEYMDKIKDQVPTINNNNNESNCIDGKSEDDLLH